ncbi:MAG: 5-formyltetrahydrofolate cyclo-ligase [Clostridiales bacterium]|nr:5-formyltetrahydrofolate cyclo-ligase [Clostridiales bacterium]
MKQFIRKEFLLKRKNLSIEFVNEAKNALYNNFIQSKFVNYATLMSYVSHDFEIDPFLINQMKKKVTIPVILDNDEIFPCVYGELKVGKYGVFVPKTLKILEKKLLEIILVPGIAFDMSGNRVGYGKGYYDKFLKDYVGIKIGCCYDWQIVDKLVDESHDVKVDYLLTEKRLYNVIT